MGENSGRVSDGGMNAPRCIAITGTPGCGKTTLLEALLARCGAIQKQGSVTAGSSIGDASPEAREHGISVEVNIAGLDFMGDRYHFMDCPGSIEFQGDAAAVLPGADAVIVVADTDEKKLPALQVTLKALEDAGIPHLIFLNKIDKAEMRARDALNLLQAASGLPLLLRQIPVWENGIATGFIDLALERAYLYREHSASEIIDMTDEDRMREHEARYGMLEALADYDDALMEQLLEDLEPPRDLIFEDLTKEFRSCRIVPVFLGSAENGNGVLRLMKALRHEAPGVEDTRQRLGVSGDGAVLVAKTLHTTHGGKLSVGRVLSGKLDDGASVYTRAGQGVRPSSLFSIFGQKASKHTQSAVTGDLVGLGKLDNVSTGDVLALGKGTQPGGQISLDRMQPVVATAIRTMDRKDDVKLSAGLQKVTEEDPSLQVDFVQETGQTVLRGQGEMHLRVALEKLVGKYGIEVSRADPQVPYRETIRQSVSERGRHKKQSGGHGQFGDVVLEIRPLERGAGFEFTDTITGGVVPKQYIPSVENGVKEALQKGPLGFPVVDVAVNLSDGSYHSVDSSDQAFKMAGALAIRQALPGARPVLLEPVLSVDVYCPTEATAKINAILSGRRGQILGFDARENWPGWDKVSALMPESELDGFAVEIRSATTGSGTYESRFDHLAELTGRKADEIVEEQKKAAA